MATPNAEPAFSDPFDRWLYWPAFAVLLVITAALMLAYRYHPFLDWPQHMSQASITEHLHNPKWGFDKYYRMPPWFFPYHAFRWTQAIFGRVFGDSIGFRAALFPYLLGMPFCAYALTKRFGRDRWMALAAFTIIVEANLLWGFAPYVHGTVLMFAAFVLAIDALRDGGRWRFALHALLGVAIFFSHPEVCGIWSATSGFLALFAWITKRTSFKRAVWWVVTILPGFFMVAFYMLSAGWLDGSALSKLEFPTTAATQYLTPSQVIQLLPQWSGLALMDWGPFYSYSIALAVVAVAAAAQWWLRRRAVAEPASRWTFAVPVMVVLWSIMIFTLPSWARAEPISVRIPSFVGFALFWLFPLSRPRSTAERWVVIPARVMLVGCALYTLAFTHQRFSAYNNSLKPLDHIIEILPRDARVATLIYDVVPTGIIEMPTYVHIGGYLLAARGGMASFNFNVLPYKSEDIKRKALVKEVWSPTAGWQMPPLYAGVYDYVLVRKGPRYRGSPFPTGLGRPVAERIYAEGDLEFWRTTP